MNFRSEKQEMSGVEDKFDPIQNLKNVDVLAVAVVVVAAAVVAVAAAVVAVAVDVDVERLVHFQDWMPTEEISSTDETLSRLLRQQGVAEIWSSACCTARRAWPVGSRAGRDGPEKQRKGQSLGQTVN